jgi:hypothetical protein
MIIYNYVLYESVQLPIQTPSIVTPSRDNVHRQCMENHSRFFRRLHFLSIIRKRIEIILSVNVYMRLFRGKIIRNVPIDRLRWT